MDREQKVKLGSLPNLSKQALLKKMENVFKNDNWTSYIFENQEKVCFHLSFYCDLVSTSEYFPFNCGLSCAPCCRESWSRLTSSYFGSAEALSVNSNLCYFYNTRYAYKKIAVNSNRQMSLLVRSKEEQIHECRSKCTNKDMCIYAFIELDAHIHHSPSVHNKFEMKFRRKPKQTYAQIIMLSLKFERNICSLA